jgi:GGDEF domain-containing protein
VPSEGLLFAVLVIDLDHFKNVNDSLGLPRAMRCAKPASVLACAATSTVSRLGGDEFTVLATALHSPDAGRCPRGSCARCRASSPWASSAASERERRHRSYPADGDQSSSESADTAMYRAKASGQAVFRRAHERGSGLAPHAGTRPARGDKRGELVLALPAEARSCQQGDCGAEALIR